MVPLILGNPHIVDEIIRETRLRDNGVSQSEKDSRFRFRTRLAFEVLRLQGPEAFGARIHSGAEYVAWSGSVSGFWGLGFQCFRLWDFGAGSTGLEPQLTSSRAEDQIFAFMNIIPPTCTLRKLVR